MKARNVIMTLALISATAFAGGGDKQFADFNAVREACKSPDKYQNQIAPSNIQIICTDVQYNWQPAGNGSLPLDNKRFVTNEIVTNKGTVNPSTKEVATSGQTVACPRFKEVTETVKSPKSLTCDEVLAYPGDGTAYCTELLNDLRKANPSAVTVADTGRTVDVCGAGAAPAPGNPSKPGRGQR